MKTIIPISAEHLLTYCTIFLHACNH